jgi:hypothetical protein
VKNNQMSASDAANLTMTAITYFKADSGIRDFLLSLLIANKTVFNCQYDGVIRQAISRRNFTSFINDTGSGCESLPQLSGTGVNLAPSTSQAATTSSSSKSKFFGIDWGCGTIGQGSDGQAGILLMLFILPLFFGNLLPAAVKVVATKRRRK